MNSVSYDLPVANAKVVVDPNATTATTTFNTGTSTWETTVPPSLSGNVFLSGLPFQLPAGFPGGINPVTWSGQFSANDSAATLQWQWAAAVYTSFSSNNNALGVKPVDDNSASIYHNSDHAGTPESFKSSVTGGARGGGGSNYTGSYSGTASATCPNTGFTRTLGFYKNHPDITQALIAQAGGTLNVCGRTITDIAINDSHSALEALCVTPAGDQRLQLVRQLTAAALNVAAGSTAVFSNLASCNATCADANATGTALSTCESDADGFNNSGDNVTAPFDPPGAADSSLCDVAGDTACTYLDPGACAVP